MPGFESRDLASAGGTVIAVGCRVPSGASACAGAAIATLRDGIWTAAQLDGDTHLVELKAVAAGDGGFVAVGVSFGSEAGGDANAIAFTSTDGLTWRRSPDQASFRAKGLVDVTARPGGGWLAVGSEAGPTVFLGIDTWTSTDGLHWTLIDSMPRVGTPRGVTISEGGFIAWGTDCLDVCGPPARAALWRSKDGSTWVRVPSQPALAHAQVDDVIETATGALAIGETFDADGTPTGTAWRTADGTTWTKVTVPGAAGHQSFRLAASADRVVTVGEHPGDAGDVWGTWTSANGATWSRLTTGDVRGASFEVVGSEPGIVGLTSAASPEDHDAVVRRLRLD